MKSYCFPVLILCLCSLFFTSFSFAIFVDKGPLVPEIGSGRQVAFLSDSGTELVIAGAVSPHALTKFSEKKSVGNVFFNHWITSIATVTKVKKTRAPAPPEDLANPDAVAKEELDTLIAVGLDHNQLYILDQGLKILRQFDTRSETHQGEVFSLAFSVDGNLLASATSSDVIFVWNTDSGLISRALVGHQGSVRAVAFTKDHKIVSVGDDGTIRLWDASTGWQLMLLRPLREEQDAVYPHILCLDTTHGHLLATGDSHRNVILWNSKSGKQLKVPLQTNAEIKTVQFNAKGTRLAVSDDSGKVTILSAPFDGNAFVISSESGPSHYVTATFFPSGDEIALKVRFDGLWEQWEEASAGDMLESLR